MSNSKNNSSKPLGLAMMASRGITNSGGTPEQNGYLVALNESGKIDQTLIEDKAEDNTWWESEAKAPPTAPGYTIKTSGGSKSQLYMDDAGVIWISPSK